MYIDYKYLCNIKMLQIYNQTFIHLVIKEHPINISLVSVPAQCCIIINLFKQNLHIPRPSGCSFVRSLPFSYGTQAFTVNFSCLMKFVFKLYKKTQKTYISVFEKFREPRPKRLLLVLQFSRLQKTKFYTIYMGHTQVACKNAFITVFMIFGLNLPSTSVGRTLTLSTSDPRKILQKLICRSDND